MLKVYLAGRISGLSYDEAIGWRNKVIDEFAGMNIELINPMRQKTYLSGEKAIKEIYPNTTCSGSKAIYNRDKFDVQRSDVILVNWDTAGDNRMIGTCCEIGMAAILNKMILLVDSKQGREGELVHPFTNEPSIIFKSMKDAIKFIKSLI